MKRALLAIALVFVASLALAARELVVTSVADSGNGTLRWALQTAQSGDLITFDPAAFPPEEPATIALRTPLPAIRCGALTIDASDAGVILSGRSLEGGELHGLEILSSRNVVRGLQILDFSGCGVFLADRAQQNTIGGDPAIGAGPYGQGNAVRRCNAGVGIWGASASGNSIAGNLIGTDVSGIRDLGNVDGVALGDRTTGNTIGPSNIIAHNRETGVLVLGVGTSGNTITRNAIHDNGWAGIRFEEADPGDSGISLDSADLLSGSIAGYACPGCEVEVFSDADSQGRTFEGRTIASTDGHFQLATDASLSGPVVTATATDPRGTTGPFFTLAYLLGDGAALQERNPYAMVALVTRTSDELNDNRLAQLASLASDVHSRGDAESFVRNHVKLGLTWYRVALDWLDWCEVVENPRFSSTVIDPDADAAITMLSDQGISVMLDLVHWDDRTSLEHPPERKYSTVEEIDRYVDYVRSVVRHFRVRVTSYALLNEPNVPEPGQFVDAGDYVELVRRTVPVIREEDPGAQIVIGEITPLWDCDGLDYLLEILDPGILPMIDGIAWHWGGASPELQTEFYYRYPELVREIRGIAEAGGFEGELLAEEIMLRTDKTPHQSEYMGYDEIPALKYTARIALTNLGLDLAAGLGFENLEEIPRQERMTQNLCTVMAGHEAIDMTVEIDIGYQPTTYCAFRYPNGDRMLAVWTDGIAQDEDPGVPATITFPGLGAGSIAGIDVLHGFEQELVFEIDGDDTIVRDLLVKDYPILIRLSDVVLGPTYDETVGDGFHRFGDIDVIGTGTSDAGNDRDGDGVPDDEDFCPDWPGSEETSGC